jgi:Tfp pilus assembly protein PilN
VARAPSGRSYWWLLVVLPVIVAVAIGAWYFSLNSQMKKKEDALKAADTELADWQAKNQSLQQYKTRQEQIVSIEQIAVRALQGRVYWARILNNIAIMCPKDIWLTSLSGTSSGGTSGSVSFEGMALQCSNRLHGTLFYPYYPDYKPIAYWLERMAQISEFQRVWLSNAEPTNIGGTTGTTGTTVVGTWLMKFSSQATLNMQNATIGGSVQSVSTQSPTSPTPSTSATTGGTTK